MKPKSKKEAWLMKHLKDPCAGEEVLQRDIRIAKRLWKRKRNKMLRKTKYNNNEIL